MKSLKRMLMSAILCAVSSIAYAAEVPMIQSYAHPTMFASNVQEIYADGKRVYVIGDKDIKDENEMSVKGKENVVVDSWVKDILATLKANTNQKVFNPKMPILRSEMAVVLAEGLSIDKVVKPRYNYKDITCDYWAKSWIDKVLNEGVMIGYPDKKFRPDQPITKAEVFATIAQLINVPTDKSLLIPDLNGYQMQNIPKWAIAPTKEVMASNLLAGMPDPQKAAASKYLSKEQVAYLVGALRCSYAYDSKFANSKYQPTFLKVELTERVDNRHSNIGDKFNARLVENAVVAGQDFPAGSIVRGEVVGISRPGIKNPGYIKVKFLEIKNDKCVVEFPKNVADVNANEIKKLNPVARVLAMPFSMAGRVAGVAGRTATAGMGVISNETERYGDDWSNAFANTTSLEFKAGARSVGKSFITIGRGIFDVSKVLVSGAFGVVYELGDEIKYVILPSSTTDSSLNPGDELVIIY